LIECTNCLPATAIKLIGVARAIDRLDRDAALFVTAAGQAAFALATCVEIASINAGDRQS
jgi:hypothetical protein